MARGSRMRHSVTMKAKMALVGDSAVGKTSLIRRFVLDEFDDKYIATLGTKVSKMELIIPHGADVDVRLDLSIFDIIGQQGFTDLVKETFFHGCQGLLAVCDITRKATLDALHKWIAAAAGITGDVPIVILVNKKDLVAETIVREDQVQAFAKMYESPYAFTSAKTGEFVEDAFNSLAIEMVEKAFRDYEARRVEQGLREKLLEALAKRSRLGLSKQELFQIFKGVGYDDIQRELEALEREGLVQINWRGEADFTVFVTRQGQNVLNVASDIPSTL